MIDLIAHLHRQAAFSHATFGPGARTKGVQDHIMKEFKEINELKDEDDRSFEWVDVAILGLDGLLRSIAEANPTATFDAVAHRAAKMLTDKQARNERRTWPDWRTVPKDRAIEHDRSKDAMAMPYSAANADVAAGGGALVGGDE